MELHIVVVVDRRGSKYLSSIHLEQPGRVTSVSCSLCSMDSRFFSPDPKP